MSSASKSFAANRKSSLGLPEDETEYLNNFEDAELPRSLLFKDESLEADYRIWAEFDPRLLVFVLLSVFLSHTLLLYLPNPQMVKLSVSTSIHGLQVVACLMTLLFNKYPQLGLWFPPPLRLRLLATVLVLLEDLAEVAEEALAADSHRCCDKMDCTNSIWSAEAVSMKSALLVTATTMTDMLFRDALVLNAVVLALNVLLLVPWPGNRNSFSRAYWLAFPMVTLLQALALMDLRGTERFVRMQFHQRKNLYHFSFNIEHTLRTLIPERLFSEAVQKKSRQQRSRSPKKSKSPRRMRLPSARQARLMDHRPSFIDPLGTFMSSELIVESFPAVTVLFVSFSKSDVRTFENPSNFFRCLGEVVSTFDKLVAKACMYKVEQISTDYVVTSSAILSGPNAECSAKHHRDDMETMLRLALQMVCLSSKVQDFLGNDLKGGRLVYTAGLHTGPLVGALAGYSRRFYRIFGDTVNVAARMGQHAPPGRVQASEEMRAGLGPLDTVEWQEAKVEVKGRGLMTTYLATDLATPCELWGLRSFRRPRRDRSAQRSSRVIGKSPSLKGLQRTVLRSLSIFGQDKADDKESKDSASSFRQRGDSLASEAEEPPMPRMRLPENLQKRRKDTKRESWEQSRLQRKRIVEEIGEDVDFFTHRSHFQNQALEKMYREHALPSRLETLALMLPRYGAAVAAFFGLMLPLSADSPRQKVALACLAALSLFTSLALHASLRILERRGINSGPASQRWETVVQLHFVLSLVLVLAMAGTLVPPERSAYLLLGTYLYVLWALVTGVPPHQLAACGLLVLAVPILQMNINLGVWGEDRRLCTKLLWSHARAYAPTVLVVVAAVMRATYLHRARRIMWKVMTRKLKDNGQSQMALQDLIPHKVARRFLMLRLNTCASEYTSGDPLLWFSGNKPMAFVLSTDLVSFTPLARKLGPTRVVQLLHDLWIFMDSKVNEFHMFKMDTIGDAYVVVSMIDDINNQALDHLLMQTAHRMLHLASEIYHGVLEYRQSGSKLAAFCKDLDMRMAIHVGPVTAGIVGFLGSRYQMYGHALEKAAELESKCVRGHVHLSPDVLDLLEGEYGDSPMLLLTYPLMRRPRNPRTRSSGSLKGLSPAREVFVP